MITLIVVLFSSFGSVPVIAQEPVESYGERIAKLEGAYPYLATKADIETVRTEVETVRTELVALRTEVYTASNVTRWLTGVFVSVSVPLFRELPT